VETDCDIRFTRFAESTSHNKHLSTHHFRGLGATFSISTDRASFLHKTHALISRALHILYPAISSFM